MKGISVSSIQPSQWERGTSVSSYESYTTTTIIRVGHLRGTRPACVSVSCAPVDEERWKPIASLGRRGRRFDRFPRGFPFCSHARSIAEQRCSFVCTKSFVSRLSKTTGEDSVRTMGKEVRLGGEG